MTKQILRHLVATVLLLMVSTAAFAAVAVDVNRSTGRSNSSTTIATTPTFSTAAGNELLLAFVATDGPTSGATTVTSVSGGGLTWALVVRANAQAGSAEVWRAFAVNRLTNATVTATLSRSVAASITVLSFTGVETTGTNGSGAIGASASRSAATGAPSASLVTTRNNSWVFGVGTDWDGATPRTLAAGQSLISQYLATVGDTYWVQSQTAPTPTAGTTVTIADTAPANHRFNLAIVEILPAADSGLTWNVAGGVTPAANGSGTTLTMGTRTATADMNGNFSFTGVADGSYTITPSKPGFTFTPASQMVMVAGANVSAVNFAAQPVIQTWSIAGVITPAASGSGTTLTMGTRTATADVNGNFSFAGVADGSYTLTPSKAGFTFTPTSRTVTVAGANVTGVAFAAQPASSSGPLVHVGGAAGHPVITNQVMTFNYTPVGVNNALVILVGCRSPAVTSMSLTAPGWTFFPISGLVGPSGYFDYISSFGAITPSTAPVTFTVTLTGGNGDCSSNDTTVLADEFSGNDITGGATTFDAHNESLDDGVIGICTGAPVTPASDNAAIWYACFDNVTGVSGGYTKGQDDAIGDWSEYKILSGGLGVPQSPGFVTNPAFFSFGLVGVSIKAAPVGAPTWSIAGAVTPAASGSGTTLTMGTRTATADVNGSFSFTGVANGSYTITPSKGGFTFTPASRTVTVAGANVSSVTFTAQPVILTWSITGAVTPAASGNGTTLTMGTRTATADVNGNFSFTAVADGSYTITPSKAGFTFTPASRTVTVAGANVSSVTFTAQPVILTWSITGAVTPAASGSGATLTMGTRTATADAGGNFSFTGVADGSYTITPSKAGFTFTPASRTVTVAGANVSAVTFAAQLAAPSSVQLIQKAVNGLENATSSLSVTFPSNTTPGSFLIVTGTAARPARTLSIADSAGNTYLPAIGPINEAVQDVNAYIWYVPSSKGGPNTITITPPAASALEIHVSEWAGLATTASLDQTASGTGNGTAVSTVSRTTTSPGELVVGLGWVANSATAGSGFTALSLVNGDLDEYQIKAAAGSVAATFTQSSGPWLALMATFRAADTLPGEWGAPFDLGMVAVNTVMMHTGKVLMFSGSYTGSWVERLWDPVTGEITPVQNPYYNLFCAGQAQLPDGRILVVGGYDPPSLGAANANIFDPVTQTWSALPNMAYRRWYPTATTLPDGRVLVTSGGQSCLTCLADLPEIFDPATNTFTTLTSARLAVPDHPFMFVLPDGSVVDAGANEQAVATSKLNVSTGTWTTVDPIVRNGHSAAMYLPGKILKTGTATDSGGSGNAAATAFVIDMNQPSPSWRQVPSMANARAFQNTTLLPYGTVLVTGGGTALDGYDVSKSVFAAELWSPVTETWRTLASASVPRLYHSTALLLPDGRVLSAGSGNDAGAVDQTAGQIFSPPYLFKGARPTIGSVPDTLQDGTAFSVQTPDSATISSVSLIRPGSVTHAFDEDQRFVPLTFTAGAGALTVQGPANANLAPPGYYMLFIVNTNGVPSVAKFVHFDAPGTDVIPPTPPGNLAGEGNIGTALLTWTASTDATGVTLYNIHRSTTSGFVPSAANRIGQSTTTSYTDQAGAAGTYFYLVTARDVAGNVSDPSNEAPVVVFADTTAPIVSITAPQPQATVTGTITVSATGSDDVSLAGIQFQLDGNALGAERTAAPYSVIWNSTTTSNGPHTLSAVARDAAGNRTTATVDVSVANSTSTPAGLVAAYGFNEGSGVQAQDSSGQNNLGTLAGATWTTTAKFGKALSFNGTNAWVTIADANSLDLTTGMTIEAWVNPSAGTGWRTVVLKEGAGQLAYSLYSANNASRPAGYVRTTNDVIATGTAAVPLNTWTHVALTYDGAALRLFVNGIVVRTTTGHGASATTGALRIGGNAIWGEYFRGIIDEVRIYNRALTGGEIQMDMATAIP